MHTPCIDTSCKFPCNHWLQFKWTVANGVIVNTVWSLRVMLQYPPCQAVVKLLTLHRVQCTGKCWHESCESAFSLDPAMREIISRKIMGVITECKHTLLIVAVKRQAFDMAFICTLLFETNYCFDNRSSFHSDVWSAVRKTLSQALNRQTAFIGRVVFSRLCLGSKCEVIHDDCVRVCWWKLPRTHLMGTTGSD